MPVLMAINSGATTPCKKEVLHVYECGHDF